MKYHKPARGIDQCPKKMQLQMFNQIYKMKPKVVDFKLKYQISQIQ